MVSDNVTQILHKAIQIYNPLVDKDYLIICSINKNHPSDYYAIRIKKDNFWHLLGCRANVDSDEVYNLCLIGKDIKMFLNYTFIELMFQPHVLRCSNMSSAFIRRTAV